MVNYADSVTLAEAVNAVVLSVGVVPIGHVSGNEVSRQRTRIELDDKMATPRPSHAWTHRSALVA